MKKFFLVFAILFAGMLFAEETVLFNASALNSASVEEYSFENWEVVPQSSLFGSFKEGEYGGISL